MKCPNCQGEIGRFELSPDCKHCGANIFYCQQKKLLTDDAKKCELEYATYRILVAKLKTAFIGGPVQILRIVAMLLAIGAIFIPFGGVGVDLALISGSFSFGAWGVYSGFTNGTIGAMLSLIDYVPAQMGVSLALLGLMVVIFLVGFGVFLALLLSFINIQRSAGIMRGLSVAGGILSLIALGVSLALPSVCAESAFITGKWGVGSIACILVFVMIFVLNNLIIKKNIQPRIDELDIKRVALGKKIKAGEISLDELSLPVFERAEASEKGGEPCE